MLSPVIENLLEKIAQNIFKNSRTESIKNSTCIKCRNQATQFRDALSKKVFSLSGLCQNCQDSIFVEELK